MQREAIDGNAQAPALNVTSDTMRLKRGDAFVVRVCRWQL